MTDISLPQAAPQDHYVTGIDETGTLTASQVGIEQISYTALLGPPAASYSSNDVGPGVKIFSLDNNDADYRVDDSVEFRVPGEPLLYMYGIITATDTVNVQPIEITVSIRRASLPTLGGVTNWVIQKVPNIAAETGALTGFSDTSLQFGGGHDIYEGAVVTLTTQADQYFDPGSIITATDAYNSDNYFAIRSKAYVTTSLVGEVVKVGPDAAGTIAQWNLYQDSPPERGIPLYAINGLRVTPNAATPITKINVSPGSIRDSTDTLDLVLTSAITKDLSAVFVAGTGNGALVQSATLAGTVSSSLLQVTGTGTAFTTDFGATALSCHLTDLDTQIGSVLNRKPSITSNGVSTQINTVTDSTHLSTSNFGLGASGSTYVRGGWRSGITLYFGVLLIRKDADGSVDVALTSFTPTGAPDLPSGYSYYRVLGYLLAGATANSTTQPLYSQAFTQLSPITTLGDTITGQDDGTGAIVSNRLARGSTDDLYTTNSGGNVQWKSKATLGIYQVGGTDVAVADGGTGSSTAAGAATNLGLGTGDSPQFTAVNIGAATDTTLTRVSAGVVAIEGSNILLASGLGSTTQAYDATLTSIAALGTAADKMIYTTGIDTWAELAVTSVGRSLLDDTSTANMRTTLGLVIDTDVAANSFKTISVSGQSDVVADSATDTLTLAAGSNITITTNASTDTVTIAATGGSGTVTTTGSPASGNLAKFSGATSIVNGDLSGDITTSGTLATTLAAGSASNLNSGTLLAARMPALTGDVTSSAGSVATTIASTRVPVAVYSATITPTTNTTLGLGAISTVDSTNDVITITSHGLTTGEQILALAGWPAGTTNGRSYYVNALTANTLALYLTRASAVADTSRVNITATTTGGTWKKLVRTNEFTAGMATSGAFGFDTGSANIGFDFNVATSLTNIKADVNWTGITIAGSTGGADGPGAFPSAHSTTVISYSNAHLPIVSAGTIGTPTTQATQATTAFIVNFTVWGS